MTTTAADGIRDPRAIIEQLRRCREHARRRPASVLQRRAIAATRRACIADRHDRGGRAMAWCHLANTYISELTARADH